MFQIEPVIWLQSFESSGLNWLMSTVSSLGYTVVYSTLITILIFGYKLKETLAVLLTLFIVGILTHGLKTGIKFPRPSDVDSSVTELGYQPSAIVEDGAGKGFWDLPEEKALQAVKNQPEWSYGFPSGHVSAATAFLLGLAFFFRSRAVLIFSTIWIPLMALSRMYLGRHFIADVVAGVLVGVLALLLAKYVLQNLNKVKGPSVNYSALSRVALLIIPLAILAPFSELIDGETVGRLLGLLFVYFYMVKIGFPSDKGKVWERALRVIIGIVIYFILDRSMNLLMEGFGWEDTALGMMTITFVSGCLTFIGAIEILGRLKLYKQELNLD